MRVSRVAAVLLACLAVNHVMAADGAPPLNEASAPKAVVQKTDHDFGTVGQLLRIEHVFEIINAGEAPLVIEDIRSSCDCLTEMMADRVVAAKGRLPLKVIFDTRRYEGRQTRFVDVFTNDPLASKLRLEVYATVRKDHALEPGFVVFDDVGKGASAIRELTLRQLSTIPITLRTLQTSADWIKASWVATPAGGASQHTIRLELAGDAPVGRHAEVLSVTFDQGDRRSVDVPLVVNVTGDIEVHPRQLALGRVAKASAPQNAVVVTGLTPEQALTVGIDLPFLKPVQKLTGEGDGIALGVLVDATAPAGTFSGLMTLQTDVVAEEKIVIPVNGQVVK